MTRKTKRETIDLTGVTAIIGGRGSGKTTFARQQIIPQLARRRIVIIDPVALPDDVGVYSSARDAVAALYAGETRITLATGDPEHAVPMLLASWAHSSKTSPIYAICDEAPSYLAKSNPQIDRLFFQGRHRAFGLALLSQRFAALSAQIRSQAAVSFIFRQSDHVDVKTAAQSIGPAADRLPQLQPGEYIRHPPEPK